MSKYRNNSRNISNENVRIKMVKKNSSGARVLLNVILNSRAQTKENRLKKRIFIPWTASILRKTGKTINVIPRVMQNARTIPIVMVVLRKTIVIIVLCMT